jgi:uncharacterized protein (DUF362 family)
MGSLHQYQDIRPEMHNGADAPAITRREFITVAGITGSMIFLGLKGGLAMGSANKSCVSFVGTEDRKAGVVQSIDTLGINPVRNKDVLLKPNFNTADRVPGSTHNDTLTALVEKLWDMGAKSIRLGERSYPLTRDVMAEKGIMRLMDELDVEIVDFDDLDSKDWVKIDAENSHWKNGFRVARPILEAECLVSTCCLKTHQYGGVFTMSLKLHVGVVPTSRHGYDYMTELHASPHQRKMIAEINAPFTPDLIVLDGIEAFVDGGPMTGKRAESNVFLASADRVAIDAVGVAILKHLGSNAHIMTPKIFEQEQIARAVELGLGASSAAEIELIAADDHSSAYHAKVQCILSRG